MPLTVLPGLDHRDEDFELDPPVIEGLWRMEERHFWHAARNRWIARALAATGVPAGARILDVGCGAGSVAIALHQLGYRMTGIDTGEVLVRKAHERCPQIDFVAGRVEDLPLATGPFDVVTLFDVLEHLDDPLALLAAAVRHARPGAVVMATVPAMRSLYTVIDSLSGHKKRYQPGELAALLERAGLDSAEEHAIFRAIWPFLWLARRKASVPAGAPPDAPFDRAARQRILLADTQIPRFPINQLLGILCELELRLGYPFSRDRPGPSLLAVARTEVTPS
jgi:SAM-dependent methyltransferase